MDFKFMSINKHSFNIVFVVVNRLSKQAISKPCYKTVTAEDIVRELKGGMGSIRKRFYEVSHDRKGQEIYCARAKTTSLIGKNVNNQFMGKSHDIRSLFHPPRL
jgi:hypothetical protein